MKIKITKIITPKIFTFLAFILNSAIAIQAILKLRELLPIYQELNIEINIYIQFLAFVVPLVFAAGSLIFYSFYLSRVKFRFALIISLFFIFSFFISLIIQSVMLFPLYQILGSF